MWGLTFVCNGVTSVLDTNDSPPPPSSSPSVSVSSFSSSFQTRKEIVSHFSCSFFFLLIQIQSHLLYFLHFLLLLPLSLCLLLCLSSWYLSLPSLFLFLIFRVPSVSFLFLILLTSSHSRVWYQYQKSLNYASMLLSLSFIGIMGSKECISFWEKWMIKISELLGTLCFLLMFTPGKRKGVSSPFRDTNRLHCKQQEWGRKGGMADKKRLSVPNRSWSLVALSESPNEYLVRGLKYLMQEGHWSRCPWVLSRILNHLECRELLRLFPIEEITSVLEHLR